MKNEKVELRAAAARLLYESNRDSADYGMLIDYIDNSIRIIAVIAVIPLVLWLIWLLLEIYEKGEKLVQAEQQKEGEHNER